MFCDEGTKHIPPTEAPGPEETSGQRQPRTRSGAWAPRQGPGGHAAELLAPGVFASEK